jgi:colicin import membrane protein
MARKLKTYETSQGFFDLVIAAPSMKAALEAWGANSNLFHQGFAKEVDDPKTVKAALAKPGILLKRPVGSSEPFREQAHLPTSAQLSGPAPRAQKPANKPNRAPSPRPMTKPHGRRRTLTIKSTSGRKRSAKRTPRRKPNAASSAKKRLMRRRPNMMPPSGIMKTRWPK